MLNKNIAVLSAGLALAFASAAQASVNQSGWSLSVLGQFTSASDTDRRTDDGFGVRVGLSHPVGNHFVLEGLLGYQDFESDTAGIPWQDEYTFGVDYQAHILPDLGPVHPYLLVGGGVARTMNVTRPGIITNDGYVNFGLGIDVPFNRWGLGLTADIKHRSIFWDDLRGRSDPNEWQFGIGLTLDLSGPTEVILVMDENVDSDGDGVPDNIDRCPGTAAGQAVDAYGCPVSEDDSDGDGVPNSRDKCPGTAAGQAVDADGCPVPETVVIYFAFDSAELNGPARAALNAVADNLKARSFVVAIANGHADQTGTEVYNMALSERRANAVAKYLQSRGVGSNQIRSRAFGETRPLNNGATAEDRARNRRVEINLLRQ